MLDLKSNEIGVPVVEGSKEYIDVKTRVESKQPSELEFGEYALGTPWISPKIKALQEQEDKEKQEKELQEKRSKAVNRLFGKLLSF